MASTRFRFRKTIPLLGRFLTGTVSKKGVSLNLRAGIFSRSWGTRGRSTTIDVPGTSGMFFRKEERRKKGPRLDADQAEALAGLRRAARYRRLVILSVVGSGLVSLGRYGIEQLDGCGARADLYALATICGLQALALAWAWRSSRRARGPLGLLGALVLCVVVWKLHGAFVSPPARCEVP